MITHIDWLSFSFPTPAVGVGQAHRAQRVVLAALESLLGDAYASLGIDETWEPAAGRAPYVSSLRRPDGGVVVFWHHNLEHALCEISGKGCETISEHPTAWLLIETIQPRVTRVDIACDMLTDTRPDEFAAQRSGKRFKAWSEAVSTSGHTVYIGSRQSDRYARVYRYNEPHPRAALLRAEHVLKAEQAKEVLASILEHGLEFVAAALGNSFGWTHADWKPESRTEAELRAWRPERRSGKTLYWLNQQVLPALVKLNHDGELDVEAWFAEFVLPAIRAREDRVL